MTISITQGLLIGLITAFCYSGQLFGIYTNRAIVMSFFVGLVLGDIPTALVFGAISELAFMGFGVSAGGTIPPNPLGPGIVGTIMAITLKDSGVTPESALALSFPFAVLFQFVTTALYTFFATFTKPAQEAVKAGNWGKFKLYANSTLIGFVVAGFIIGSASAFSLPALTAFVEWLPTWLINGFSVAGGLIPAIGFSMILSVMLEKELVPYILVGYICAAYLELPTMGIALVGAVFALIKYYASEKDTKTVVNNELVEEDYSNGI